MLAAIACVRALHEAGKRLPFAVEVVAFGDEEGVRFGITMSGSRALAGTFDPTWLSRTDTDGVTFAEALRRFGGDPDAIPALPRSRSATLAYIESHIEQGPVLLDAGLAVGVVTAIAGATACAHPRHRPVGSCRHRTHEQPARCARGGRGDGPRCGARCRSGDTLVGTVGQLTVRDGAANVIPGQVEFTLDVRSGNDGTRLEAVTRSAAYLP